MPSSENINIAVSFQGVSKKYRLFPSSSARLLEMVWPWKRRHTEFWALRDIDLTICRGETLGILGKNGSGKSTLLQLIAGIFPANHGSLAVNGRISALLELGVGFNLNFSGRENALLAGALQNIPKREIQSKMEDIEAFADIGQFFDQPVRTYSSGMFVRLAFAAAINVDPDILLIDEALAVGDVSFQQKCYRKIAEFQAQGKTVVLVTHQVENVARHCSRAILLDQGRIVKSGHTREVVNHYLKCLFVDQPAPDNNPPAQEPRAPSSSFLTAYTKNDLCSSRAAYNPNEIRYGSSIGRVVDFLIFTPDMPEATAVPTGAWATILAKVRFDEPVEHPVYGFKIKDVSGQTIFASNTRIARSQPLRVNAGSCVTVGFPIKFDVPPGDYFVSVGVGRITSLGDQQPVDRRQDLIHLVVTGKRLHDGIAYLPVGDFTQHAVPEQ